MWDNEAPLLDWNTFYDNLDWQQGEHIGLIGPTGSGKSVLTKELLPMRKYVVYFATKPRDKELDKLISSQGFHKTETWPPMKGRIRPKRIPASEQPRIVLWPDAKTLNATPQQSAEFRKAISEIYAEGGWCVVWDEYWFMNAVLDLEKEGRILLQQARSNNISFVMGSQRPSRIPLEVFDQSTHLFFWKDNDERNLKRMSGIGWLSADMIKDLVANLEPHQFLYVNTRTGAMARSIAPYKGK